MLIWRGALPRTGGTVCINIAEYMLKLNDVDYKPVKLNDVFSNSKLTLPPERYGETLIGSGEGFYSDALASEPFHTIFVARDIRDTFASWLKVTNLKFEDSLGSLEGWIQMNLKFLALPPERCLQLHYEEDVLELPNACKKIARFLGLEISDADITNICETFSKQAVGKHIDAEANKFFSAIELLEGNGNDNRQIVISSRGKSKTINIPKRMCSILGSGEQISGELPNFGSFKLQRNFDGTYHLQINTIFLKKSQADAFNQGHITNPSSWNVFFSAEQQELINREILRVLKTLSFLPTKVIMIVLSNNDAFKSLEIFRPNPDLNHALQHLTAGRLPEAEAYCEIVLQTDPNQPVAIHWLGLISIKTGDLNKAVELISKALAIKPDYVEAQGNLNNVLKALG
jgi:tetratricopeptide (TPR) repeat protein